VLASIAAAWLAASDPTPAKARETVLYTFQGGGDAANTNGPLVSDQQGNLYGTTFTGGESPNCNGGCGTVFKLTRPAAGQTQ
jgi:uncharacterized repeat protein (TIGR03803 family)